MVVILNNRNSRFQQKDQFPGQDFIGLKAPLMPIAPWALQRLLEYVKLYYENAAVMIHENGNSIHFFFWFMVDIKQWTIYDVRRIKFLC